MNLWVLPSTLIGPPWLIFEEVKNFNDKEWGDVGGLCEFVGVDLVGRKEDCVEENYGFFLSTTFVALFLMLFTIFISGLFAALYQHDV